MLAAALFADVLCAARPDDSWCEGPLATAMAPLGGLILYTGYRLDLQPTSRAQSGSKLMTDQEAMEAYAAGQPVPAVDAADIKAARELARRVDARKTTEGAIGIDLRLFVEICTPGANVPAIRFSQHAHLAPAAPGTAESLAARRRSGGRRLPCYSRLSPRRHRTLQPHGILRAPAVRAPA